MSALTGRLGDGTGTVDARLTPTPVGPGGRVRGLLRAAHRDPLLALGVVIVGLSIVLVFFGQAISPYDPVAPTRDVSQPPSAAHWFGTDSTGLDIFSRVLSAPAVDVVIGLAATGISFLLGTLLGLMAGYFSTRSAQTIIRISDVFQSFPIFILAMILVVLTGRSVATIIFTLGLLYTPIYLRLTCAEVVSQVSRRHVEAARAIGNTEMAIAFRHVLPNSLTPALIQASVTVGWAILFTAGLTFLGAGVRPPTAEWGGMIASGANLLILHEWWPSVFPGIAISVTVLGYAIVGNALEARFRG